jgi:hypothetical protein
VLKDGCAVDDWDAIAQGTPGLGYTVSHEAILSSLAMGPPPVFRTEVMCQNLPSLGEPVSPLALSSFADPRPDHQRRRAPSLIMSRKPVRPECVCDAMPGFDSLEPPGKIEPAALRDRLDLIVAGTTSPSPSAFHIIDHLVAGAPGRKQRNAEGHPGLRSPTARCDDCSE